MALRDRRLIYWVVRDVAYLSLRTEGNRPSFHAAVPVPTSTGKGEEMKERGKGYRFILL